MNQIGFIGWRGMVGSVLMERMIQENDFQGFEPLFFSTSNIGGKGPDIGLDTPPLKDAFDLDELKSLDIIVTCQGSDYTKDMFPKLRQAGWEGYWIDASSALRMDKDSIIVLDPVNRSVIDKGIAGGVKNYIGGNCTVTLMLMALSGLFAKGYVEWLSTMTYQAASGAGAENMKELMAQMVTLGDAVKGPLANAASTAIEIDRIVTEKLRGDEISTERFGAPLAGSVLPWIDSLMDSGQTREEWKGIAETNKILQTKETIPVDGLCVRVGAMRCHSQGLTIKLNKDLPLDEVIDILKNGNKWVAIVPNDKDSTLRDLTPAAVNGTMTVPVGRIRKMNIGPDYITAFTVGDQLLWGAAEPLRRVLNILLKRL